MKRTLRVLVAEDSPDDCELLLLELGREFDLIHQRVDTREEMVAALEAESWDLVLCDWSMPRFSALDALALLRDHQIDAPCIIASGTIGEDVAVEALRNGARDFLVKDQLARLRPAVARELREAAIRAERNKMQQQLMIADRMASIGMLAAGVAHEINNPLAAVMSNVEVAIHELNGKDFAARKADIIEALEDACSAATRIRDIMRDLKLFSRGADDARVPLEVHKVVSSALRMAQTEIRHRATLELDLQPVPRVEANESRFCQVILNLVINAAQAIPEGRAEHNFIRVSTERDSLGHVVIQIADTGRGIAPDVLEQVFTPFFTTKSDGGGMGLGLSICHRIVGDLGGEITVESQLDVGTTFRVRLPASRSYVPTSSATEHRSPLSAGGQRSRLLVIDDDVIVARGLARALRELHDVEVINRAATALTAIEAGDRFDVIICDVMMPEMTGADLHAALTQVAPDQAAAMIFLTGGAFTQAAREFLATVPNSRLEKPFQLTDLIDVIARKLPS